MRRKEADDKGQYAEIDVPDQPGADQRELLAQREIIARQQPFANTDRAQGVVLNG